ncbi:dCTP deaminase domain-containing protein [Cetobacterium sp.]|uniref:dCTP deaminase domain-containing protein n=1 Tax=Cetobacterium sp. TaxID=2071632 RepID=UPI003EE47E01
MWFRNGILSDKQFMKHYGKDIFLYPFDNYNLKGASYNLTASRVAYYKDEEGNFVSALVKKDKLILPAKKIIFIQTEEVIYVNQRICGTYHTKVKWVSLGLSSISTTLDPCYFGTSLVAVKNLSEDDIEMDVGETFCTVIFHKISSGNKDVHDNVPFRKDVSSGKIYKFENMIE